MGYLNNDISLKMLFDRKLMSKRSFTVCKQIVKDPTLENIINFYNSHGSFIKVRYCGLGTDAELIKICKSHNEIIEIFNETLQPTVDNKDIVIDNNTNPVCNSCLPE